jgi:hypothetical protein
MSRTATQPFQGCVFRKIACVIPGLPKRNPGLELANAFSVKEDSPAVNCWASIIRPLCGLMNLLFLCEAIWHLNPGTACSIGRFGFLVFIEAAVHRDEERCPGYSHALAVITARSPTRSSS